MSIAGIIRHTLEHGDFWGGNITVTGNRFVFFDWAFSCVAHPFFSLGALAPDPDYMPTVPGASLRLRDAYLKEWADYGAEWELLKAFELSQPLGLLHSALTHYLNPPKNIPSIAAGLDGDDRHRGCFVHD